jgi:hypothetical protein
MASDGAKSAVSGHNWAGVGDLNRFTLATTATVIHRYMSTTALEDFVGR